MITLAAHSASLFTDFDQIAILKGDTILQALLVWAIHLLDPFGIDCYPGMPSLLLLSVLVFEGQLARRRFSTT